jgi:23S rRNA (cytosine1962-C5)-methyltransferase
MQTWQLRKGAERRFHTGHPWVFSNELTTSPKGLPAGELVTLTDESGKFLATGYGNPNSLISFRSLTPRRNEEITSSFFLGRFKNAVELRRRAGVLNASHRVVFAEGDYLPGLIIDRYLVAQPQAQVFVIQSSTAGMDRLSDFWMKAVEELVEYENKNQLSSRPWSATAIVLANTSNSRRLENIPVEPKKVVKSLEGLDLRNTEVLIESALPNQEPLVFNINILEGQKTGFFLDQRQNIKLLLRLLQNSQLQGRPLRVLDLCCYVGQWSAQIAAFAKSIGLTAELHLFDASDEALKLAAQNVVRQGGQPAIVKGDVLKSLSHLPDRFFDVVICDPPAFIKKKKDIPTGTQAYLKLNKEARRKTVFGGTYVSCSCSGLLTPEDFKKTLARISYGEEHHIQWLEQGFHSPDHPQRLEFPEGTYLKCMIGFVFEN